MLAAMPAGARHRGCRWTEASRCTAPRLAIASGWVRGRHPRDRSCLAAVAEQRLRGWDGLAGRWRWGQPVPGWLSGPRPRAWSRAPGRQPCGPGGPAGKPAGGPDVMAPAVWAAGRLPSGFASGSDGHTILPWDPARPDGLLRGGPVPPSLPCRCRPATPADRRLDRCHPTLSWSQGATCCRLPPPRDQSEGGSGGLARHRGCRAVGGLDFPACCAHQRRGAETGGPGRGALLLGHRPSIG
jgi:hypothetical protein